MKSTPMIAWIALALSSAALMISLRPGVEPDEGEIRREIESALVAREQAQVRELLPKVERIYPDMLGPEYTKPEKDPETLIELFKPMVDVIIGINPQ